MTAAPRRDGAWITRRMKRRDARRDLPLKWAAMGKRHVCAKFCGRTLVKLSRRAAEADYRARRVAVSISPEALSWE